MMCWILPGTSMDLNLAGRSAARCGTCRSPSASTSTISSSSYYSSPPSPEPETRSSRRLSPRPFKLAAIRLKSLAPHRRAPRGEWEGGRARSILRAIRRGSGRSSPPSPSPTPPPPPRPPIGFGSCGGSLFFFSFFFFFLASSVGCGEEEEEHVGIRIGFWFILRESNWTSPVEKHRWGDWWALGRKFMGLHCCHVYHRWGEVPVLLFSLWSSSTRCFLVLFSPFSKFQMYSNFSYIW